MIAIGEATATATIDAPIEAIDVSDWMFTLTSEEYAACAQGHHSAAQGTLRSGKRVSINVETVAGYFMVQHYVEQHAERSHVVGVSPNTVMWVNDEVHVLAQITWELELTKLDRSTTQLRCRVLAQTENALLAERTAESLEGVAPKDTPLQQHIDEETPLFAKDIERKANANRWSRPDVTSNSLTAQVVEMLEDLYNRGDATRLRALAAPDIRHYSSAIGDGVDAWVAYAERFAGTEPLVAIHRTVSEGNRIGVHAHYRWNTQRELDDGPGVAVAHIFTVEGGRIVEAVELTQAVALETVSGHDMFSQVRPSLDGQEPERNRRVATRVVKEFLAGETSLRDELLSDYIQHNPVIPSGAEGIAGFIDMLGGNPNDFQWTIVENDLALTYTRYLTEKLGTPPLVTVDIWRFDAEGKVTEHWDVLEADFTSPAGHSFPG